MPFPLQVPLPGLAAKFTEEPPAHTLDGFELLKVTVGVAFT